MAKMKVYELAKELEIQSRDIVSFLQGKGYEVKAAQSSIEDTQIGLVKREFSRKSEKPQEAEPQKEAAAERGRTQKEPKRAETEKKAEEGGRPQEAAGRSTKENQAEEGRQKDAQAPVKKKRNIIFVSNPHNSKMPGGQRPPLPKQPPRNHAQGEGGRPARPLNAGGRPAERENARNNQAAQPEVKAQSVTRPAAAEGRAQSLRPQQAGGQNASSRTREQGGYQQGGRSGGQQYGQGGQNRNGQQGAGQSRQGGYQQGGSQQGGRSGGQQYGQGGQNRNGAAPRREGAGRNDQRGNDAGNRTYRGTNQGVRPGGSGGQSYGRPGDHNSRPEKRDDRPGNQFRKPAGGKGFVPESPVKDSEKHRDEEKRRLGQEKDKRSKKDLIYEEEANKLKNKPGRFIKPEKKADDKQEEAIKVITIPETITIKELADKMKLQPSAIVKKLFLQGKIVTVNQEIPFETAEEIAIDYDIICEREVKVDVIEELLKEDEEKEENLQARPPVICVMGHVDHGKTSLLDAIRKTNVTDKEAGGITQHIGAYTVNAGGQTITFLDTPGHEAFTAMRMRGANSTDIAILVVAADDGVMPQTVEAINHAKAAGIEIIVAVNKIDKPNANVDRVKQELAEYELIPVDWGGTTEFVPVSAKAGTGIEDLLETILLTAEILELKANPERMARGLVIEAELDKGRGPVATILVQKGTLHVGDFVSAGASHGKVRAMIDDKGRKVKEAGPSTPVEILGLSDVPNAGEVFLAHENDKTAKSYAETYLAQNKERMLEDTKSRMSLDDLFSQIQAGNLKELNLIIKADVQGSVEAVKQSLLKLSNEEVIVKCIHGGVGAINESDVSLASASNAIIIGFNVRPDATAKAISEREGVDVRLYKVIYQAIEDVEAAMKGMLDPVYEEKVIGHAEVRQIFKASAVGNIAGAYVLDGTFQRNCKVRITREGRQIFEGPLASLKRFKDDVKEVKAGFECGLVFEDFDQIQELDIVEAYIMVEVPR